MSVRLTITPSKELGEFGKQDDPTGKLPQLTRFLQKSKTSKANYEKASRLLPGGVARDSVFYSPHPIFIRSGRGCNVVDLDGNKLIDFHNNFTSLIHGHSDPDMVRAVKQQLSKGTAFAAPTELEYKLVDLVSRRMPSIEKMRFGNSGLEATLAAIMGARAYTKRYKIIKFEGGFRGLHPDVMVSTHPTSKNQNFPKGKLDSIGINPAILDSTYVLPYNDLGAVEELIRKHSEDIAAIIVEPMQGVAGDIPGDVDFLKGLRELCTRYGTVLIFDEIVTGFRLSMGGAQEKFGIRPDLTALGKNLGGGFPVGGFGGSKEVMSVFDPLKGGKTPFSGTFSGNPVTLTAGLAALSKLKKETYRRMDSLSRKIEDNLNKVNEDLKLPLRISRVGSLFNFHFVSHDVKRISDLFDENKKMKNDFYLSMFDHGILIGPRGLGCISTPMGAAEIEKFNKAMDASLEELKVSEDSNLS